LNFKNSEIKKIKSYASCGIRTRNPWGLRLRNTCAIGCAKKTAENVFYEQLEEVLKLSAIIFCVLNVMGNLKKRKQIHRSNQSVLCG